MNKIVIFFLGFLGILGIVFATDFYSLNVSQNTIIDEHSVDKKVTNNCTSDVFIPTKSSGEWSSFVANNSTCMTVVDPGYSWLTGGWSGCSAGPYWGSWGSCSVSCGGGTQYRSCNGTSGTQSRSVWCQREDGAGSSDAYCGGGKPSTATSCSLSCSGSSSQSCNTQSCYTYGWAASGWSCNASPYWGGWSSCSASCGGSGSQSRSCYGTSGTSTRSVWCQRSDGASVSDGYCGGGKPGTSTSCSASCSGSSSTSCSTTGCYSGGGGCSEVDHPSGSNASWYCDSWSFSGAGGGGPSCGVGSPVNFIYSSKSGGLVNFACYVY